MLFYDEKTSDLQMSMLVTLVQKYNPLTHWPNGVKCIANSVARNKKIANVFRKGQNTFIHIFGSFQDSIKGSQGHIWGSQHRWQYMGDVELCSKIKDIFQSTFHPFVIVLYFYRAHEYKFSEKLAVVAIKSLNFWQWCS